MVSRTRIILAWIVISPIFLLATPSVLLDGITWLVTKIGNVLSAPFAAAAKALCPDILVRLIKLREFTERW